MTTNCRAPRGEGETRVDVSVTAIVVTYGQSDMVRTCLASLEAHAHEVARLEIVVVDNCSPDDTAEVVATEFPDVRLIASPTNDGFAVANNKALRDLDTDYALLFNPDCILEEGVLEQTVTHMENQPHIGMLGCRLVTLEGTFDHAAKRSIPDPAAALRYFLGKRSGYLVPDLGEREIGDVEAINGAYMLVRRQAVEAAGLLDERYWMYAEDLDWCVRFRAAGWRVVYYGASTCTHLKSMVSGRARSPKLNWHFHRSMAIFYRTHQGGRSAVLDAIVTVGIYGRMAVKVPTDLVRRQLARRTSAPAGSVAMGR